MSTVRELLVCPNCHGELHDDEGELSCRQNEGCLAPRFRYLSPPDKWPVLMDLSEGVISASDLFKNNTGPVERHHPPYVELAKKFLKAKNRVAKAQISRLLESLPDGSTRPLIVVVGGGSIGQGVEALYQDQSVEVIGFDIYASDHVQFLGDAHSIPLPSASIDGVVVQAVLEHVLVPSTVVSEIGRILKPGGVVYSETPFMQQVHEGPWDFTRFTESGHRYLFRDFDRLDSGWVAGLGTQLYWSIVAFCRGLTRRRTAGSVAKVAFFWLPRLDPLMGETFTVDGASCVFFLGKKSNTRISAAQAIAHYGGAQ